MSKNTTSDYSKQVNFELFRYQLVVDKTLQKGLFDTYESAEELRADKNNILQRILTDDKFRFRSGNSEVSSKLMYKRDNMTYFKLGIKRKAKIYKPDFSEEFIENYPNVIIAFNNHPDTQLVAIQNNKAAFGNCLTASHIIQKSIDRWAKNSNLNFFIEPQFDSREFWNLVRQHAGQITQVTFDLVTPNLAKISKNLKVDLKALYNDTNTQRTKVELNAEPESHLDIKEDSEIIRSIVDYGAEGGGNISMRVAGLRRKLHTAQSPKDFDVDEHLVNGNNWEALDNLFRTIMI